MKVFITGSNGLVGYSLRSVIQNIFEKSKSIPDIEYVFSARTDLDLMNEHAVNSRFEQERPDIVVHLASRVGGLFDNIENNYTMLTTNSRLNMNIIEACKKYNVKCLINVLSTCIFPANAKHPLRSKNIYDGESHSSNRGYAMSKQLLHTASKILSKTTDTKVINLIPTNLYGTHDNYNIKTGHVIPALINKILIAKRECSSLFVSGDGKDIRQFLHAEDLSRVIVEFIKKFKSGKLDSFTDCIVSPPKNKRITIKGLVELLCHTMGYDGDVVYVPNDKNITGQKSKISDDKELRKHFKDFQLTPLKEGLKRTCDYVMSVDPNILRR